MKRADPGSKRKRIILYYALAVALPGLILGFLAFRGIRNDQALREKQSRNELQLLAQDFFRQLDAGIPTLPDSLCFMILERDTGGVPHLVHHHLIYLPDRYLSVPAVPLESPAIRQAWNREYQDKKFTEAQAFYQQALTESTTQEVTVQALNGLARVSQKTRLIPEAIMAYQDLISNYPAAILGDHLPAAAVAMTELIRLHSGTGDQPAAVRVANQLADFLSSPPVEYEQAHFSFLYQALQDQAAKPDSQRMAHLAREKERTDFLIAAAENQKSLFNGESGKKRYLDSKKFPALFVQKNQETGVQTGKIFDLKKLADFHIPLLISKLDPDSKTIWNIRTEFGENLFAADSNSTASSVQIGFPPNYPPWNLILSIKPQTKWAVLFGTSQGLFIFVFAFIALLMVAGLVFMVYTLNQEMKLSRMKSDFISNVSHEFKTPLTSIRHMTEIMYLKRIKSEPRKEEYLQSMLEQCDHLGHLIENILDFSKIEEDIKNYRFEWHNPDELLRDLLPVFRSRVPESDFKLTYQAKDEAPLLYMDKDAMLQVFYNLMDNALKYSGEAKRIEITLEVKGTGAQGHGGTRGGEQGVEVRVRDWGLGIPEKDLPRIFERFYRGDKLRTEGIKGSGIGLTIVKRIVEAHKGEIRVESKVGEGSVFTVYLPIDQNQPHDTNSDR